MTITEMLAKRDKLSAAHLKAQIDTESIFAAEKERHDKQMVKLNQKAEPFRAIQEAAKSELDSFNQTAFGEMVIDTRYKEWQMTVYRAGSNREWFDSLGWYRVMSSDNQCWWTLDIRFSRSDENYNERHIGSQTKFGPGRLAGMPTSYYEEGRGFMEHFWKVKEAFAEAGVVLIEGSND